MPTTCYFDDEHAIEKRPISPTFEDASPPWKKLRLQPSDVDCKTEVLKSSPVDDSVLQCQQTGGIGGLPQDVCHMDLDEQRILENLAPINNEEEVPGSIESSSAPSRPDTCLGVVSPKPP